MTSRFTKNALGVGLAIAKRLVQLHAGSIEAHWRGLGYGAEFVVRLPLVPPPKPAPARERQPPLRPAGRRLKVLVVEDNHDLVQMLEWAVKGMGHEVRSALDGRTAISAALACRPDVVLLDLGLPIVSGLDVARELRRHP